jgi:hypothetical protein
MQRATSLDLMKCSKPLRFVTADKAYPLCQRGTAFLVQFQNRYFCVTAQHSLDTCPLATNPAPDSICIWLEHQTPDSPPLPFKASWMVKSHDETDWHFSDVGVYEIESHLIPESELQRGDFLDLEGCSFRKANFEPGTKFLLRGYPSEFNYPDYENVKLHIIPFELEGTYGGPDESSQHCSLLQFGPLVNIKSSDGFSGSPVFARQDTSHNSVYQFAGMLVRAGEPSAETFSGRFINGGVILEVLRRISNGDKRAEQTACSPLPS